MSSMLLLPSWKEEPLSPPSNCGDESSSSSSSPNIHFDNTTFYDDNFEYKLEDDDLSGCESKAEVASHILENLENLVDLDELIKDEPYLLDVKMLPPLLEDVEPPRAVLVPIQQIKSETINIINNNHNKSSSPPPDPETTQYLLNEFETMYDVVELAHHGTLTPPQSPPSVLTTLEPLLAPPSSSYHHHHSAESTTATSTPILPYTTSVALPQDIENGGMVVEMYHHNAHPTVLHQHHHQQPPTDIAHELAVVDELVRSRVEDMQWSSGNSCSGSSSPGSPGGASSSSNFGDCSSDDPEWVPDAAALENLSSSQTTTFPTIKSTKSSRKQQRSKPYTKAPPEEKKVRKKEQNKNAATRYRLKKKAEVEEILTEEKILLDKSTDLGNQITDLQREIKYLKGLMRDLFKAKGLLN